MAKIQKKKSKRKVVSVDFAKQQNNNSPLNNYPDDEMTLKTSEEAKSSPMSLDLASELVQPMRDEYVEKQDYDCARDECKTARCLTALNTENQQGPSSEVSVEDESIETKMFEQNSGKEAVIPKTTPTTEQQNRKNSTKSNEARPDYRDQALIDSENQLIFNIKNLIEQNVRDLKELRNQKTLANIAVHKQELRLNETKLRSEISTNKEVVTRLEHTELLQQYPFALREGESGKMKAKSQKELLDDFNLLRNKQKVLTEVIPKLEREHMYRKTWSPTVPSLRFSPAIAHLNVQYYYETGMQFMFRKIPTIRTSDEVQNLDSGTAGYATNLVPPNAADDCNVLADDTQQKPFNNENQMSIDASGPDKYIDTDFKLFRTSQSARRRKSRIPISIPLLEIGNVTKSNHTVNDTTLTFKKSRIPVLKAQKPIMTDVTREVATKSDLKRINYQPANFSYEEFARVPHPPRKLNDQELKHVQNKVQKEKGHHLPAKLKDKQSKARIPHPPKTPKEVLQRQSRLSTRVPKKVYGNKNGNGKKCIDFDEQQTIGGPSKSNFILDKINYNRENMNLDVNYGIKLSPKPLKLESEQLSAIPVRVVKPFSNVEESREIPRQKSQTDTKKCSRKRNMITIEQEMQRLSPNIKIEPRHNLSHLPRLVRTTSAELVTVSKKTAGRLGNAEHLNQMNYDPSAPKQSRPVEREKCDTAHPESYSFDKSSENSILNKFVWMDLL